VTPPPDQLAIGLAKIALALKHHDEARSGPRGLSATQGRILAHLHGATGRRRVGVGDLARELAVRPPTISASVAALVRKGLVRRRSSSEDGRAVELGLTARGRREAGRFRDWPDGLRESLGETSAEERGVLLRFVTRMIRAMQVRGELPVSRMCATCAYFRPHVHASASAPHHCDFVGAPFGDAALRLDCPDHEEAAAGRHEPAWAAFSAASTSNDPNDPDDPAEVPS